ncbi:MAG: hypothetical protein QOE93_586 [Actinomycetota bacterium]|nr:hypothetical protein [Actinomycetota bacterium]
MVLAAIVGTLRIALSQPDQTATTETQSDRTRRPAPRPEGDESESRSEWAAPQPGQPRPVPVMMTPAMPAGFQWIEATPVPRFRSGFVLVVMLAVVGALLAMTVAGFGVAVAVVVKNTLA